MKLVLLVLFGTGIYIKELLAQLLMLIDKFADFFYSAPSCLRIGRTPACSLMSVNTSSLMSVNTSLLIELNSFDPYAKSAARKGRLCNFFFHINLRKSKKSAYDHCQVA